MSNTSDFVDLLNREMYELKIADLEAKLVEKEKECQELLNSIKIKDLSNINFIQVNEDIVRFSKGGVIYEYNKKENTICKIIDLAHQEKIEFAVEQLTLFKNTIVNKMNNPYSVNIKHILSDFDNQIKQLKEME